MGMIKSVIILALLPVLIACGGGGASSSSAGMTTISGILSDDAISSATITATSVDTSQVLGTATTGSDGSFTLNLTSAQIGSGYKLSSVGGTMNGAPFTSNLSAIYPVTGFQTQSNVTLLTHALSAAAVNTSNFAGSLLERHEAIKSAAIASGTLPTNWNHVEPTGNVMADARKVVASSGVDMLNNLLIAQIDKAPTTTSNGCLTGNMECWQTIGSDGVGITINVQGATVQVPTGALKNCKVTATYSDQSIAVQIAYIASQQSTAQLSCIVDETKKITLTLPTSTATAPNACLTTTQKDSGMQSCVTAPSQIAPAYFVIDGSSSVRIKNIMYQTIPSASKYAKLSRSYGAVLNASLEESNSQWSNKTAVLFVHGYQLGTDFGGNDGTWGVLPDLVTAYTAAGNTNFVALNFQWRTDASYLDVADDLAKAVDYAYSKTGKPVHIIAHSFGGVLSRVMLQNLNGNTSVAAAKVTTLTTVGTPHSGIVDNVGLLSGVRRVEGVDLPKGWAQLPFDKFCGQITCYQSGLNASIPDWAKDLLRESGALPDYGYVTARLLNGLASSNTVNQLPAGLKVKVLIGQAFKTVATGGGSGFYSDDRLITYLGKRFIPQTGESDLLTNTPYGGATITEQRLGLNAGTKAAPSESESGATPYAAGKGYIHSPSLADRSNNFEVYVPATCNQVNICQHDTWLAIKEVLDTSSSSIRALAFADEFAGTTLDASIWNTRANIYNGVATVSAGNVVLGNCVSIDTATKKMFGGSTITVEARYKMPTNTKDGIIELVDITNDANYIHIGQSTYANYGLYTYGAGLWGFAQINKLNGIGFDYTEVRITVAGTALKIELGTTLSAITQTITTTLPVTTVGKTFYLRIGTGCNFYYPAVFDWVNVAVVP